jgi:hypothetical protein
MEILVALASHMLSVLWLLLEPERSGRQYFRKQCVFFQERNQGPMPQEDNGDGED